MSVNEIEQTAGGATFRHIDQVHWKSIENVSMLVSMSVIKGENSGGASTNRTDGAEYVEQSMSAKRMSAKRMSATRMSANRRLFGNVR